MKKIAFLTSMSLEDYILDEEFLENEISKEQDVQAQYIPWNQPDKDWSDFHTIVIRTTWDYTENLDQFLKALKSMEEAGAKLHNSYEIVKWNSKKTYLKDLKEKGVSTVPSFFLEDGEKAIQEIKDFDAKKFVIKPVVGASSHGIQVLEKTEALTYIHENLNELKNFFVQPFLEEVLEGEISYFYYNGVFSHAVRKTPKKGDFRVQEEYGGLIVAHEPSPFELQEAEKALKARPQSQEPLLYARVDAIYTESTPWHLIELELIEPSMFFRVFPQAASNFKKAILDLN